MLFRSPAADTWRYNHPYRTGATIPPKGMTACFVDGSSAWVDFENLTMFVQYDTGNGWLWPDPKKN